MAPPAYKVKAAIYQTFQNALTHAVQLFNTAKIKPSKNELYNTDALQEFKEYANKDLANAFTYEYTIETIDDIQIKFELQEVFIDNLKCATNVLFNPILQQEADNAAAAAAAAATAAAADATKAAAAKAAAAKAAAAAAADTAKDANDNLQKEFTNELQVLKNKIQQYTDAINSDNRCYN